MSMAGLWRLPPYAALGWGCFFLFILAAWAMLFAMGAEFAARAPIALLGPGMEIFAPLFPETSAIALLPGALEAICFAGPAPGETAPAMLVAMWALMALAMMAPTAFPVLRTYSDFLIANPARVPAAGFYALLLGFCLVWLGFALIGAVLQWLLSQAALLSPGGLLTADWMVALLLALAGLYQFSALKAACLARCRSPMAFFFAHWREGAWGALRMGLRQGLYCLGCCWALMALAFVGGTMNLVWMGAAMILMSLEKLPQLGRAISAPLGVALLITSLLVAGSAVTNLI